MADHLRTQVRDAALAKVTGLTTTGSRAYAGRPESRPLQESEIPGWLVYTNEEEIDPEAGSGRRGLRRQVRFGQLMLHGVAVDATDLDKTLDTMSKEAEAALAVDVTLGGLCADLYLTSTVKESANAGVEKPTGKITLTFTCEYHTREGVPDAPLA